MASDNCVRSLSGQTRSALDELGRFMESSYSDLDSLEFELGFRLGVGSAVKAAALEGQEEQLASFMHLARQILRARETSERRYLLPLLAVEVHMAGFALERT